MTTNGDPTEIGAHLGHGLTTEELLDLFDAEGRLLLETLTQHRLSDDVPFCPGWTLRDLVTHLGYVYRWAAMIVSEGRLQRPTPTEALLLHDPDDADDDVVIARLERAHAAMGRVLRRCGPTLQCWTIWPALSSHIFWARRMLHETVIHRVDVENTGQLNTSTGADLATQVAADGVDEMICGFAQRYSVTLRLDHPATIVFNPSELNQTWWARIGPYPPEFGRGRGPAHPDTEVRALSGELLLLLWNRRGVDGLEVSGDRDLLVVWAGEAHL